MVIFDFKIVYGYRFFKLYILFFSDCPCTSVFKSDFSFYGQFTCSSPSLAFDYVFSFP